MDEDRFVEAVSPQLAVQLQVMTAALVAGCVVFGVIAALAGQGDGAVGPVGWVMAALTVAALAARIVLPQTVDRAARRRLRAADPSGEEPDRFGALAPYVQQRTILGAAILEGAAFANLVAFLIEGGLLNLLLAAAMIAGVLLGFPTRGRIAAWIKRQYELANLDRGPPGR